MRIGIDYRILSVDANLAQRGMVRYTQEQLRQVLAIDSNNEYVVFCHNGADLALMLPQIRRAPNVSIRRIPSSMAAARGYGLMRTAETFQTWLAKEELDVYHITTPFFHTQPLIPVFDVCPMVATLYDLTPLLYQSHYLANDQARANYLLSLGLVARATRLLAISHAAARDADLHLGFPRHRIDVAWPTASPCFHPMSRAVARARLQTLNLHNTLPREYALAVTALHHAKNVETCLRAYAMLDARTRARLPFVFGGLLEDPGGWLVGLMEDLRIIDDVMFTGLLTDEQLAAVYSLATFVVHPSRHEGFGLPVLEAMKTGTPVITTTSSSLPEVAGDAAILVDPGDVQSLSAAMSLLSEDEERRNVLRARGLERAKLFSAEALAKATLRSYARAASPMARDGHRPRISICTPLPPQPTPVADHGLDLLEALGSRLDVDAFVDEGVVPPAELLRRHRIHHVDAFPRHRCLSDATLYKVGSDRPSRQLERWMRDNPGVVDVHDVSTALLLGGVLASSIAVIAHTTYDRDLLVRSQPDLIVQVIPLAVVDPYRHDRGTSTSRPERRFVVGAVAGMPGNDRLDQVLKSFRALLMAYPDSLLLVVGWLGNQEHRRRLDGISKSLKIRHRVRFTGPLAPRLADAVLTTCDVVVDLAPPTGGAPPSTLLRAAAAAKPVILSSLHDQSLIRDEFSWQVAPERLEVDTLASHLRRLAGDGRLRAQAAFAARELYEKEGTLDVMAGRYLDVIREAYGSFPALGAMPPEAAGARDELPNDPQTVLEDIPTGQAPAMVPAPREPAVPALLAGVAEVIRKSGRLAEGAIGLLALAERQGQELSAGAEALGQLSSEVDAGLRQSIQLADRIEHAELRPLAFMETKRRSVECQVTREDGLEFTVLIDPEIEDPVASAYLEGAGHLFNHDLVSAMLDLTAPGDWILDLGAHLGTFSLAAAAAGRNVIAVEASPANAALLRASVARNGFSNIRVIEAAAGDSPVDVDFCQRGAWGHLATDEIDLPSVTVPGVTIGDLLYEVGAPPLAFIKIDIEGSEIRALRGMSPILHQPDAPPVLYEVNCHTLHFFGHTAEELVQLMEDFGYRSYLMSVPHLIPITSREFYPQTVGDHLAIKDPPDKSKHEWRVNQLRRWELAQPLTTDERVSRIVADCAMDNEHVRRSMARRLAAAGSSISAHPRIQEALNSLLIDPEQSVRDALDWLPQPAPPPHDVPHPSRGHHS